MAADSSNLHDSTCPARVDALLSRPPIRSVSLEGFLHNDEFANSNSQLHVMGLRDGHSRLCLRLPLADHSRADSTRNPSGDVGRRARGSPQAALPR